MFPTVSFDKHRSGFIRGEGGVWEEWRKCKLLNGKIKKKKKVASKSALDLKAYGN